MARTASRCHVSRRVTRWRLLLLAAAVCCLWAAFIPATRAVGGAGHGPAPPRPAPKRARADFVPGEVLVRFRDEGRAKAVADEMRGGALRLHAADGRVFEARVERFDGAELVPGLRLARTPAAETWAAVEALRARADVAYAEPNYRRRLLRVPNDPRFLDLWGLREAGSEHLFESATAYGINAERAWDITTGDRRVVVGVVDEGLNVFHPDLAANAWRNPGEEPFNGLDDDGNGHADDLHGWDFFHDEASVFDGFDDHGTHVAGTIGAVGDNGLGVVGVNWQVSLMSLKVFGREGETSPFTTIALTIRAFNYARKMRELWESSGGTRGANLRVLNNSYGGFDDSAAELDAIRALDAAGILFVAAAGNTGRSSDTFPTFPASYDVPNVISVAGGGSRDNLLNYTNFGAQTVHLSAPGFLILSTVSDGYAYFQGTSMAAPHVAGTAALVWAAHPDLSHTRVRDLLLLNGDLLPAHEGMTMTRRRLNAFETLRAAAEQDAVAPARIPDLRVVAQQGRRLTLAWTAPGDDGAATGAAALYEVRLTPAPPTTDAEFRAGLPLYAPLPEGPRTPQGWTLTLPLFHTAGYVSVRAVDNVGNRGAPASVAVSVDPFEADPYVVADSEPLPLSTGGAAILGGDDGFRDEFPLPFEFPIFGRWVRHVDVSTNGALYFELPPDYRLPPITYRGILVDAEPTTRALRRYFMIAPLWDDLKMSEASPTAGVWWVVPDPDRAIFRWEGVTFDTPLEAGGSRGQNPVNFEVELRRDGTIQMRYGEGNTRVFPIVGISGGTPDADAGYVVASHTSEHALRDLTRARTLTFTPRRSPRPASSDLRLRVQNFFERAPQGGQVSYTFLLDTLGPDSADGVTLSYTLPPATTFVGVSSDYPEVNCTTPAAGAHGTVTCHLGRVGEFFHTRIKAVSVTLQTHGPAGSTIVGAATAAHAGTDPSPANNTAETATALASYQPLTGVKAIAPGFALLHDGTLWHWGRRLGTIFERNYDVTPVRVNLDGVTAISASMAGEGGGHAVALKGDGSVWTWGFNNMGQLGMGKPETELRGLSEPARVPGLPPIRAVAAGPFHTIALAADGTVWTWGTVSGWWSLSPVRVEGLTGVAAVAAGGSTFAAVKHDGTLWMWGSNFYGLLATGAVNESATPIQVAGLSEVSAVAIADSFAVALRRDGSVWSWGWDVSSNIPVSQVAPAPVPGLTGVAAVAATTWVGGIALKSDGTVWTLWPPHTAPTTPVNVERVNLPAAMAIASTTSSGNVYVLLADGTLRTWGPNSFGELGDGTTEHRLSPVTVRFLAGVEAPTFDPGAQALIVPRRVRISCPTEGAVVRYTTDGREPTETDAVAGAEGIWVSRDVTLRARAFRAGWAPSIVATAVYQVATVANVIDTAPFYVAQHYRDFLSREPDAAGLAFWTAGLDACGADAACREVKRVDTSAAFFLSIEFQETGYLVYRLHKTAFGDIPGTPVPVRFEPFSADTLELGRDVVVGLPGWPEKLEQNKQRFALDFVNRPQFTARHPATLSPAQFVDALNANAGGVLSPAEREGLVQELAANDTAVGRAGVLRQVAEDADLRQREFRRAFVLMQYFGYLRRDPDAVGFDGQADPAFNGFNFWLTKLNDFGGDFRRAEMVRAFIESIEYRQRFGP